MDHPASAAVNRMLEMITKTLHTELQRHTDEPEDTSTLRAGVRAAMEVEAVQEDLYRADAQYGEWFADGPLGPWQPVWVLHHAARQLRTHLNNLSVSTWIPPENRSPRAEALIQLHAHSLVITSEIELLLAHGYPAGAAARWRTLHELQIIARLLARRGQKLSQRYLDSRWIEMEKSLVRGELIGPRSRLRGVARQMAQEIEQRAAEVRHRHGDSIAIVNGWARPVIKTGRITFEALERAAGRASRRGVYRQASQRIHGGTLSSVDAIASSVSHQNFVGRRYRGLFEVCRMTIVGADELTSLLLGEVLKVTRLEEVAAWDECHCHLTLVALLYQAGAEKLTSGRPLDPEIPMAIMTRTASIENLGAWDG